MLRYVPEGHPFYRLPGFSGPFLVYFLFLISFFMVFISKVTDFPIQQYLHLPVQDAPLIRVFLIFRILNPLNLLLAGIFFFLLIIGQLTGHSFLISPEIVIAFLLMLIFLGLLSVILTYGQFQYPIVFYTIFLLILGIGIIYALFTLVNSSPIRTGIYLFHMEPNAPLFLSGTLCIDMLLYAYSFSLLKRVLFVDRLGHTSGDGNYNPNISKLERAKLLRWLEYRLLWRNSRTRMTLFLYAVYIVFWGLWLMLGLLHLRLPLLLGTLAVLHAAAMYYTIHAFQLRSTIFDRLATFPIKKYEHINLFTRFSQRMMLLPALLILLVSYAVNGSAVFFVLSGFIYSLGVVVYIHAYAGSFETARSDPALSVFSSANGLVSHPWYNMAAFILTSLLPAFVVLLPRNPFQWEVGLVLLVPGMLGLIGHNKWIRYFAKNYTRKKYKMLEGFRG